MSSAVLELAQQLIRLYSITPEDAGCQDLVAKRLKPLDFGPVNASIHKLNEHIELDALDALKSIYRQVLERLLLPV
jgi:acetylornithine deacetylase/succinyl-diaminopimelate desuccinylase-like protein